jgi:hypothetical protein
MPAVQTLVTAAAIFAVRTRVTPLDPQGYPAVGAGVIVSASLVKATITPVVEAGDDIVVKAASGDLAAFAKHGDMIKRGTLNVEMAVPDPNLVAAITGGVVFSDTTAALGLPTGTILATPIATGGVLAAGSYGYRVTQYGPYGETMATPEVVAVVAGPTGSVHISGGTLAAGAMGMKFYGRIPGQEQLLGKLVNIGSQATSAATGTGSPATLAVTALTQAIPQGYTFEIAGDATHTIFTTTAASGTGSTTLAVTVSAPITTAIPAGAIVPTFVDDGTRSPFGHIPTTDLSAGPGHNVGYQEPALGPVSQPYGVSIEFWMQRFKMGQLAPDYPYYRFVHPAVKNGHMMPYDVTNANKQTIVEGDAFENSNWGGGPFGDWQFDSSKWNQYTVSSADSLPDVTVAPIPASV